MRLFISIIKQIPPIPCMLNQAAAGYLRRIFPREAPTAGTAMQNIRLPVNASRWWKRHLSMPPSVSGLQ